jgi:hypothetical protein
MNKNIKVLKLYRKLLYTMMYVFKGDYETFHVLRITIRKEIEKRRELKDEKEIREKILDLEECRNAMLTEVMQGKLQEGGFYRFKARPENVIGANPKLVDKINKI